MATVCDDFANADRVIYRVIDSKVVVYVIADSERDMQALLVRRLLRSQESADSAIR